MGFLLIQEDFYEEEIDLMNKNFFTAAIEMEAERFARVLVGFRSRVGFYPLFDPKKPTRSVHLCVSIHIVLFFFFEHITLFFITI